MIARKDDPDLFRADGAATSPVREPLDDALCWIERDITAHSGGTVLVICGTDERYPVRLADGMLLSHRARGSGGTLAVHFADASFSRIYAYRAIAPVGDESFLADLRRVLRHDGALLTFAQGADFTFAPLPTGGDARALRRSLQCAGFAGIYLEQRSSTSFVLSARRRAL